MTPEDGGQPPSAAGDGGQPPSAVSAPPEPAPERQRNYVRPNPRILEAVAPSLVYIGVQRIAATEIAIAASFVAAVVVFMRNPGRGTIRALSALGFFILLGTTVVSLALGSGKVFVAQNLFIDFIFVGIFTVSALIKRPLIGAIVREFVPALQPVMALDHPLFIRLTLLAALMNLVTGLARVPMIFMLSASEYAIASRVIGFPLSTAFYFYCYFSVQRTAIRIWPADLPPPKPDGTPGDAPVAPDGRAVP